MENSITPIKDVTFKGLHWIEASAGSGKTFTLSSLMVRALIESYMPDQIVATTFTRAATAELKERIRGRLIEVYRFLEKRRENTEKSNLDLALELDNKDELLALLLRKFAKSIDHACQRTKLVIEQLDRLYVGTLDSFSQKMLREFAFESGRIEKMEITENSRRYTQQIIHDVVRSWVNKQTQEIVDSLFIRGEIKTVDAYTKLVEDSLNFSNAEFKSEPLITDKHEILKESILSNYQGLCGWDLNGLSDYYNEDGCFFGFINGQTYRSKQKFTSLFTVALPMLFDALDRGDCVFCLSSAFSEHLVNLKALLKNINSRKIFTNKMSQEAQNRFYDLVYFNKLSQLIESLIDLDQLFENVGTSLKFYICQQVKSRLPSYLQVKGETTFSQQIKSISDALNGANGELFAQSVHQRYPLIIVDEFQDTNQDQDNILAAIWRDPARVNKGCMIMVGDRKQAIYGFRGGDMLTYVNAHNDVKLKGGHLYSLVYNHRTVPKLVEVIDALFKENPDFGEHVIYTPVSAGNRPHPALIENGEFNPSPLRYVELQKDDFSHAQMAYQVIQVLNQGQRGELGFESPEGLVSVVESDLAILAKSNDDLDRIQFELEKRGVAVDRPSRRSIFEGILALDVGALLSAILYSNDDLKVRRALTSSLLGYTVNDVVELETNADKMAQVISSFRTAHDLWFDRGFLTAWQFTLEHFNVWENLLRGSGKDCERNIVNLRHISEVLSQYHSTFSGPQSLQQWFLRQVSKPSERDWELERNLSSSNGVKLMTIHKSKGLEFPIVFLFKANGGLKEIKKTLNYSFDVTIDELGHEVEKRVIHIGSDPNINTEALSQHSERLYAENRRQWYVALTRASHRVYLFMGERKPGSAGVDFWWCERGFSHEYCSRIQNLEYCAFYKPPKPVVKEVIAHDIPNMRFYGKVVTNFSAISQYLTQAQAEDFLAEKFHSELKMDESTEANFLYTSNVAEQLPTSPKNFPAGVVAGTFLHGVLEDLDFQAPDTWKGEIIKKLKNGSFILYSEIMNKYIERSGSDASPEDCHDQLANDLEFWFQNIIHARSSSGFSLSGLKNGVYLSEMPFVLSLADRALVTKKISSALAEYGLVMPELNRSESARYLNGSIDLVFQHNGKYCVADYKGNLLGHDYSSYTGDSILKNMSKSSYFLQAIIYLVALHRFLKANLKSYSIEEHLGGAYYLYLRGMKANSDTGIFEWCPDHQLVLKVDSILGQYTNIEESTNG